ncbi:tyrosine-type recombinase/integrase [Microbacterium sp. R86528]|uniref:tyrosine-type recombinase/integrase n=1 Tax=Microbacterium sp. R86528 TaxID=3093864 RepID=UPI0037C7FA8D
MNQNIRLTDISAELSSLRAAHPQLREAPCSIILRYKPNSAALAGAWAEVRPFTITTAAEMAPDTFDVSRRLMTMTAQFHIWAWSRTGTQLNVPVVYTQNNIDRFLSTHLKHRSPHHRWGVSRQLVKVGRELADADLIALPAPNGKVRAPFAPKQIATMHSWANALTTVKKRQNAHALLGLAGGAGLTAAEIVETRVTDIIRVDNVVLINVREGKSRLVPVRHAWARVLLRSIEGREHTNEHLFRGHRFEEYPPRTIQTFLTDHPAKVRPTPSLLRNSWILHHINNDVPPQALMEASGLDCFQTLGRYYEHAQARKLSDYTSMLVGAEAAR